jgi:branched-chain amino acid transport system permease protein
MTLPPSLLPTPGTRSRRYVNGLVYVLVLAALPWTLQTLLSEQAYAQVSQVLVMAIYSAMAATGLNLMVGYTGLLTMGYGAFMLIGCYTAAILVKQGGWTFWEALPAAGLHAAFWGIVLGLPTLRLRGDYFAIVTLGFGELVNMTAKNWVGLTRGPSGYPGVPRPEINLAGYQFQFTVEPNDRWAYIYLGGLLLGLMLVVVARLARGRIGRAWRALREDEAAAEACGIWPAGYKTLAFALSAGMGGIAGAYFAALNGNADFRNFDFMTSIMVLAYVVLGGMGTVAGPVLGAAVLYSLGEVLRLRRNPLTLTADWFSGFPSLQETLRTLPWAPEMRLIVFGMILLVVMRLRPSGLVPARVVPGSPANGSPSLFRLPRFSGAGGS